MANWLVAVDTDEERRRAYLADSASKVAPVAGLRSASHVGLGWSSLWAASASAPVDTEAEADGGAIVWGEPRETSGAVQTAVMVRSAWRNGSVAQWDGYFAAAVIEESGRSLTVGADILGIFPIYYWTDGEGVVLAGTSPELFGAHPQFKAELNLMGLVGILLTNGLVGGGTLWRGVRRLGPGCRLRMRDDKVWEERIYEVPTGLGSLGLPLIAHVDQLADALGAAVKRHARSDRPYGLLLSGGLDSRMLAGFLTRAGIRPRALTIGLPTDLEMRCAKSVSDYYSLDHVTAEPGAADYPDLARLQARWEHLANGFNTLRDWWTRGWVAPLCDRLVTGILGDSVVGGTSISWAYSGAPPTMSYENFVRQMPQLGVPRDLLLRLCKGTDFDVAVKSVENELRQEFEGYGDRVSYCAWRYDLAHGQRYHVGSTAWRLSFGAWPVLPILDRQVIATAANMPAASLADRSVQIELVKRKLPELGSLPLDRSDLLSDEPQYLRPTTSQLLTDALRRRLKRARNSLSHGNTKEARYWYRVNDFDSELWKSARAAAEPQRELAMSLFDPDMLRTLLPPPTEPVSEKAPRIGESGRKLLLGFLYWAEHHLA